MDAHIRDLRYFVAVAEELSFTRAATARLFISQPALSKQIGHLEALLRARLFTREHRGVSLTPAGESLLPTARRIIDEWDAAQRSVADAASRHDRTLTVGFHTRIGRGLIPSVTAEMQASAPDWRLKFRQIMWSDPSAGLADGTVDLAIAWLPLPESVDLSFEVVAQEDRWVALPLGHRLAERSVVPFAEIATEPAVALPASAGRLRAFWLGEDARTTPARVAVETETADEAFEAVATGLGIALVSEGNARIYERDDVVFRPVSGLAPSQLAVAWRPEDNRPVVRMVIDACSRCLCTAGTQTPLG